jgi:hypothetical protein
MTAVLVVEACFALPRVAHGQFLGVFDSIFSSIQSDMGSSLKAINQIKQQVNQLYQTTVWPLTAINQATLQLEKWVQSGVPLPRHREDFCVPRTEAIRGKSPSPV